MEHEKVTVNARLDRMGSMFDCMLDVIEAAPCARRVVPEGQPGTMLVGEADVKMARIAVRYCAY
jgi:hypothetical protein